MGRVNAKKRGTETHMTLTEVMIELEALGTERTKKQYIGRGAHEPLFGVATGAMKPLFKRIKRDQALAEQLYATGNYDAMYFAGMIADPNAMTEADFDRWMETAYFPMLSNYVVAVTLSEADCAQRVADRWIKSEEELRQAAGWSCYEWLLGYQPDSAFEKEKILFMLRRVESTIHNKPIQVRRTMNNFVTAVGVSYLPLHEEAVKTAQIIGDVRLSDETASAALTPAKDAIQTAKDKGRIGFKRRAVRC